MHTPKIFVEKCYIICLLEKGIPRGIIGLNYLSKFVCTQWAVWLMYSSSWILVGWKFYCLTNSNASSVYTNLCTVLTSDEKSILLNCLMVAHNLISIRSNSSSRAHTIKYQEYHNQSNYHLQISIRFGKRKDVKRINLC